MQITTHAKNYTISDRLMGIVTKKLDKIKIYFDDNATCAIVCSKIGKTEKMELSITQKSRVFRAEAASGNMYVNIDLALAKIERQIIKHREKLRDVIKSDVDDKKFAFYTKPPKVAQAEIMKHKSFSIEKMSVGEAEIALDTSDHSFYIYGHIQSGKVNIMYRRADGHVGILEVANSKIT